MKRVALAQAHCRLEGQLEQQQFIRLSLQALADALLLVGRKPSVTFLVDPWLEPLPGEQGGVGIRVRCKAALQQAQGILRHDLGMLAEHPVEAPRQGAMPVTYRTRGQLAGPFHGPDPPAADS